MLVNKTADSTTLSVNGITATLNPYEVSVINYMG